MSRPVTAAPRSAAGIAALPVPVPTSSTVIPASIATAPATAAPTSAVSWAIAS